MGDYYTAAQLIGRIRWLTDTVGLTNNPTDADLAVEINASARDLRRKLFAEGSPTVLAVLDATTPSGATSSRPGTVLPETIWGAAQACAGIRQVRILDGSTWRVLREAEWSEVDDFGSEPGTPQAYLVTGLGAASYDTAGPQRLQLMLLPATDQAYPVSIVYLSAWVEAPATGTGALSFPFDLPGVEFVISDVCRKLMIRQREPDMLAAFTSEANQRMAEAISLHKKLARGPRERQPARRLGGYRVDRE